MHTKHCYLLFAITQLSLTEVYQLCVSQLSALLPISLCPSETKGQSHIAVLQKKFNSFEKTLMFLLAFMFLIIK